MKLLQKNKIKNNQNTELTEMGVFSAVAGNQLPNLLQKRVLPALFHLRCPSQSHQRSARGRTRLTTVTSISCRSFQRQLLYLFFFLFFLFVYVLFALFRVFFSGMLFVSWICFSYYLVASDYHRSLVPFPCIPVLRRKHYVVRYVFLVFHRVMSLYSFAVFVAPSQTEGDESM